MGLRITLSDIARETGYSKATVSLALRDDGRLLLKTRRRIRSVATNLGYRPNPLLASLASARFRGSSQARGTPLAYLRYDGPGDIYKEGETLIIREAQRHVNKLGYRLETFDVAGFKDGTHLFRVLFARGVQGILLAQLLPPDLLAGMDWTPFSVAALGERVIGSIVSPFILNRAAVDHFGLVQQAWTEAWKRGYRRIGVVLLKHGTLLSDDEARFGAVAACQARDPSQIKIPVCVWTENQGLEKKLIKWVRRYRPDAILGFNGWILHLLQGAGFRIPDDLGFVALHTTWGGVKDLDFYSRRICAMKEMVDERMHAAVELLDQQIRHHQQGLDPRARTALIHSEWVEGDTLPPKAVLQSGQPVLVPIRNS